MKHHNPSLWVVVKKRHKFGNEKNLEGKNKFKFITKYIATPPHQGLFKTFDPPYSSYCVIKN
jgi:hypothetical protein